MVLIVAVMQLGRTMANIAHDVCRLDILIGRYKHYFAGTVRGLSEEKSDVSFSSIADAGHKMQERSVCCLKSLHGKLDEKSIIAVFLPLASNSAAVKARNIDEFAFSVPCRHGAKRLLNTANFSITVPLNHRAICTLANPMESKPKKTPSFTNSVIKQQVRQIRRIGCAEWCGEDPCNLSRKETLKKPSMWINPDCYKKCERPFRYDIVHMPGTNKATREYQRTWIECPPLRILPKAVCCREHIEMPPICRRPKKARPPTATYCQTHNDCKIKNIRCPKAEQSPCCDVARDPPCCKVFPTPACCHKRCTPFPSFSECCRPEFNKKAPNECICLGRPTMCEVYADWRKRYQGTDFRPLRFTAFPE